MALGCACAALAILGAMAGTASAAGLTWSTPVSVGAGGYISCVSTSLCVSVGSGYAVTTTDPAAATPTWSTAKTIDANNDLTGVSCPSTSLCVAVDGSGDAVISTDPTAATPSWSAPRAIDATPNPEVTGVSCASTSLCVAVDNNGNAVISRDPTAATPAWSAAKTIDTNTMAGGGFLAQVSCPSTSLCVSTQAEGDAVVTNNPTASSPAWSAPNTIDTGHLLIGLSCTSTSTLFCVATDNDGNVFVSPTPGNPSAWSASVSAGGGSGVSCASTSFCVAIGAVHAQGLGNAVVSTDPAANNWSAPVSIDGNPLEDISCPSTTLCVAVDLSGNVVIGHGAGAPPPPAVAPKISAVSQSASKWVENNEAARISSGKKLPVGTSFSLKLSEAAKVSFAFTQSLAGRKVGKRCVAKTGHNAHKPHCTRTATAGTLTFAGQAGTITVRFGGRVSKHLKLKPGSYALVITATASKQTSTPHTLHFTIA
jgi:hypothetical protein